jgi:disulfide bond formation protein DsbB
MKNPKLVLLGVAFAAISLLGVGLYMQHVKDMQPCPWCVIQRYAFAAVALICLITAALPRAVSKFGAGLGMLAALGGIGAASWHLWVQAHPEVSCGIDPMETSLNTIPTAKLLPFLFTANGFCTTPYDPILGLSIPQWSLLWFSVFAIALGMVVFKRAR